MVTQSDQDIRISRLESIAQRQESPWSFITCPWYYRDIANGSVTGSYNTNIAMPTAVSTFAGVSGRDFVAPRDGYLVGCFITLSKGLLSGSIAGAVLINGVTSVFEDTRITNASVPSTSSSYLSINPENSFSVQRGANLRPMLSITTLTFSSTTIPLVANIALILAFKVQP